MKKYILAFKHNSIEKYLSQDYVTDSEDKNTALKLSYRMAEDLKFHLNILANREYYILEVE